MTLRRPPVKDGAVKAALYARVSTDDGRQTLANQVQQLRELAAAREFGVFREYTDEETDASATRTSFLALLRDARLRRFRVLLITDLDRLPREGSAAAFAHLAELDRYGVRIVSLGQGWLDYDPRIDEDPELREMRNIQTVIALTWAALERQKISRRTKAGLERARGEGKRLGRKPVDVTGELSATTQHLTSQYLNNIIEADHAGLKRVLRATRGFQTMQTAYATSNGFEIMRMIRRRHCILCEPGVAGEIRSINKLCDVAA